MERFSALTLPAHFQPHSRTPRTMTPPTPHAPRRSAPRGLAVIALLAVAACAGHPPPAAKPAVDSAPQITTGPGAAVPHEVPSPGKTSNEAGSAATPRQDAMPPKQAHRNAPVQAQIRAAALIGMDALAVEKTLGPPRFIRRDLQAQIWQYASATCILDLFLYPPASPEDTAAAPGSPPPHSVLHVESHTREGAPMSKDGCLHTLEAPAN